MSKVLSQLRASIPPFIGLCACSFVISSLVFDWDTLVNRVLAVERNRLVGFTIILVCHLSSMAVPVLILQLRKWWLKSALLLFTLVVLVFESTIFLVMGEVPTYHDYLSLFDVSFEINNAYSEYRGDIMHALGSVFGVAILLATVSWLGQHRSFWIRRLFSPGEIAPPWMMLGSCSLVVSVGFGGVFYLKGNDATRGLTPGYGLPLALALRAADSALRGQEPSAQELSVTSPRSHHIFLIIDESVEFHVMQELWSETQESRITGPPIRMLSYANSSACSNVLIRYACDPRHPDRAMNGDGLLRKAKEAGYRIIYYDNQAILRRRYNFFGIREQSYIDEHYAGVLDEVGNDIKCLPGIIENLQRYQPPTLILMNKSGPHYTYEDRFRPEQARPGEPAYHTAVRVTSVEFLQKLVASGVLAHTSLYYTSDHGQDWQSKVPHGSAIPDACRRIQWQVPGFALRPGDPVWSESVPDGRWLSQFHLMETLNNELGYDDPRVPNLEQALDPGYKLNGDHEALFVYPFATLGQEPIRKTLLRVREKGRSGL